jgi:ribosomal protein S7
MKKYNNYNFYIKFINSFLNSGLKIRTKRNIDLMLNKVSIKNNIQPIQVLYFVYSKLCSIIEVKKLKIRNRSMFIPFPINLKRRFYLASFFLKNGILERKKKQKKSYSTLLELEINSILANNQNNSYTLKLLNKYFIQVLKNRSNAHFRW